MTMTHHLLRRTVDARRAANATVAWAALLLIAEAMEDHGNGATRLLVESTDQDDSGALVAFPDGGDDELHDLLSEACIELDDSNAAVWTRFLVGDHSTDMGTTGYLDMKAIRANLTAP